MRFLADENFDNNILRGILSKSPDFDCIRVQDTELYQADDEVVLAWAAEHGRILLTHDVRTMTGYAHERIRAGLPMPDVFEVRKQRMSTGQAITELLTLIGASEASEWANRVTYLPLR